jgi:hypothetical protein
MNYELFENDKDKTEAIVELDGLVKHPGWKYITKALDANIAFLSDELREKKDFTSLEELYALQDRIDDFESFKELPATLTLAAQPDPPEVDTEVY